MNNNRTPGSRRSRQERSRPGPGIRRGVLDDEGRFPAERYVVVTLVCKACGSDLIDVTRMIEHDDGAIWGQLRPGVDHYNAGPDDDPESRYAFDCSCGRPDILVRRVKLELATAELRRMFLTDGSTRAVRLPV